MLLFAVLLFSSSAGDPYRDRVMELEWYYMVLLEKYLYAEALVKHECASTNLGIVTEFTAHISE